MLGLKTRGGQPTGPARSEGDRRPETTAAAARPRAWPSAAGGRHAAQRQSLRVRGQGQGAQRGQGWGHREQPPEADAGPGASTGPHPTPGPSFQSSSSD